MPASPTTSTACGCPCCKLPTSWLKAAPGRGGGTSKKNGRRRLPLALLQLHPLVKGGFLAQPEAVEERTAHQGEGMLDLGGALLLSGGRGECLGFFPGLLHHVQVQLE